MTSLTPTMIDAIVGDVLDSHPMPTDYAALDDRSRDYLEQQATKAGTTPEALFRQSRARANMSAGQAHSAILRDRQRAQDAATTPERVSAADRIVREAWR